MKRLLLSLAILLVTTRLTSAQIGGGTLTGVIKDEHGLVLPESVVKLTQAVKNITGKSGTRHSDPSGKSHADFIEFWQRQDTSRVHHWTHMWGLGKPIIAAVNGWAMGGGFWYQLT